MSYYRVIYHDGMNDGESLSHHGILGMKWGVRRYQNPDGTLTDEGKRRYRQTYNGEYVKRTKKQRAEYDKRQRIIEELDESLEARQEALKFWKPKVKEDDLNEKFREHAFILSDEVSNRSINWYDSEPISDGQKKIWPLYEDAQKQIDSLYESRSRKDIPKKERERLAANWIKAERMICIQALKDMNIPVNDENIESMEEIVFWD